MIAWVVMWIIKFMFTHMDDWFFFTSIQSLLQGNAAVFEQLGVITTGSGLKTSSSSYFISYRDIGGSASRGGGRFHTSAAEGSRKNSISAPKASKSWKNRFFEPKNGFLAQFGQNLTKKCFLDCGVSSIQIFSKVLQNFEKMLARWDPTRQKNGPNMQ